MKAGICIPCWWPWLFSLLLLVGCIKEPDRFSRTDSAVTLAANKGWRSILLDSKPLGLVAFVPTNIHQAERLTVYIEGDGLSWVTRTRPSINPTPTQPVALKLALKHTEGAASYLARPCQYVLDNNHAACQKNYWTNGRFSEDVVRSSNRAISQLKQRFAARQLNLVGYSGGGTVASLVAARRNDVRLLVTVAGNLDHVAWTHEKHLTPLVDSLNPADYPDQLVSIRQFHLIGDKDNIIPRSVSKSYTSKFPTDRRPKLLRFRDYDHGCCWDQSWPGILPRKLF